MSNLIKKSLLTQVREAREDKKLSEKLEKKVESVKKEVQEILEERYKLILGKEHKEKYLWDSRKFSEELQLILRSVLNRDEIIKIPGGSDPQAYNLTTKHGLKYPRAWSAYNFLPYREDKKPALENEIYKVGDYPYVNFSVLKDSRYVNLDKLEMFFFFLKKVIKIYNLREKIEKEFVKHFKEKGKGFEGIESLHYADLEEFEAFLEIEPILKTYYLPYCKDLDSYENKSNNLLEELKTFNKPFRLFLTLKNGTDN